MRHWDGVGVSGGAVPAGEGPAQVSQHLDSPCDEEDAAGNAKLICKLQTLHKPRSQRLGLQCILILQARRGV